LEEARLLRQFLNEVLLIFRKAKANPAVRWIEFEWNKHLFQVLGADVSKEVAAELKRIYQTLKNVKSNAESAKIQRKK
jgi:hypothetical protein